MLAREQTTRTLAAIDMITFKVSLNGTKICTAGVRHAGVLSAIVTCVRRKPQDRRRGGRREQELSVEVGGLDSDANEHLRWLSRRLRVGDRLAIAVVESETADTPTRRHRDDPRMVQRAKRRYFERLKKEYATDPKYQPSGTVSKATRKTRG
jgi:hypothetical protein